MKQDMKPTGWREERKVRLVSLEDLIHPWRASDGEVNTEIQCSP